MNLPSENCEVPEEKPICMNNFYMLMPGGYYRQLVEDCDDEEIRLIAAIDDLLASEFAGLDVVAVMNNIVRVHRMIISAAETGTLNDQLKVVEETIDYITGEKEKLRPLFNRLVERGFDPVFLAR